MNMIIIAPSTAYIKAYVIVFIIQVDVVLNYNPLIYTSLPYGLFPNKVPVETCILIPEELISF